VVRRWGLEDGEGFKYNKIYQDMKREDEIKEGGVEDMSDM